METILNLLPLDEEGRAAFLAAAPGQEQIFLPAPALRGSARAPAEALERATVILGSIPPEDLARCPRLKWLQAWSAGTDAYQRPGVFPPGAALTCASGAYGQSVSEHMLASMLALMKRLPAYRDNWSGGVWRDEGRVKSPAGSTVLVLGTGDIGGSFARLVRALGGRAIGFNRHPEVPAEGFAERQSIAALDQWLPQADVVACALPASPDTAHLMDRRRLALMRPDAILINAGRGSAVDCLALAEALRGGRLWGAALDVTEPEPLPAGHPLWDCPNLLLTPHVAGGDHLEQTARNVAGIALSNLRRFLAGEALTHRVL